MLKYRTPFLAVALLSGVAAVGLTPAFAQATPAPQASGATPSEAHHQRAERMLPGQLIDGRIAFLKAELKITPAQEAQWQNVAVAMRDNAKALDQVIMTARQNRGTMDAVQRLETRGQFAKLRADNDGRLLAAFKPLYASLSPEQQHMANELIGAHHHGWHHRA